MGRVYFYIKKGILLTFFKKNKKWNYALPKKEKKKQGGNYII